MKKFIILFITISLSCTKDKTHFPSFEANRTLDFVDNIVYGFIKEKEISLIYYTGFETDSIKRKVLSFSNNKWEKMEILKDVYVIDSTNLDSKVTNIYKTIVVRKECDMQDENEIWNNLKKLKVFELPDEKDLIKKCLASDTAFIANRYRDGFTFHLQIVANKKVRSLLYHNPDLHSKDCKQVVEWKYIMQLNEWFEEEWFSEEHFKKDSD